MTEADRRVSLACSPDVLDLCDLRDSLVVYHLGTRQTVALQPPASDILLKLLTRSRTQATPAPVELRGDNADDRLDVALAELAAVGLVTPHDA